MSESQPEGDKLLWHYTTAAGLMGIVTSGCLRFGNARFLNDRTEHSYGWSLLSEVLSRDLVSDDELTVIVRGAREILTSESATREIYLCSLSEKPDSLSQWQRYVQDGHGYCLGFRKLDITARQVIGSGVTLRRMIYDEHEQRQSLEGPIEARRTFRRESAEYPQARVDTDVIMTPESLAGELRQASFQLKNPSFEDESEWRLIFAIDGARENVQRPAFVARGPYLAPYVDVPITAARSGNLLPLETVVCGPRLERELAEMSVSYLLRVHGYNDVRIQMSRLGTILR